MTGRGKKAEHLDPEMAARGEAQLRFVLNFTESTLVSLGSGLDAAAGSAVTPEVAEAFRATVKGIDAAYKIVTEARRKASSAINQRALRSP